MIINIGFDVIEIKRIEETFKKFGHKFTDRCFSQQETALAFTRSAPWKTLAKRFAAKEACGKALGTGLGQGVRWTDIEVLSHQGGHVTLSLHGQALSHLQAQIPTGHTPLIHVSLSDDETRAYAWVIISAEPDMMKG